MPLSSPWLLALPALGKARWTLRDRWRFLSAGHARKLPTSSLPLFLSSSSSSSSRHWEGFWRSLFLWPPTPRRSLPPGKAGRERPRALPRRAERLGGDGARCGPAPSRVGQRIPLPSAASPYPSSLHPLPTVTGGAASSNFSPFQFSKQLLSFRSGLAGGRNRERDPARERMQEAFVPFLDF